jgi:hypothetical protein
MPSSPPLAANAQAVPCSLASSGRDSADGMISTSGRVARIHAAIDDAATLVWNGPPARSR